MWSSSPGHSEPFVPYPDTEEQGKESMATGLRPLSASDLPPGIATRSWWNVQDHTGHTKGQSQGWVLQASLQGESGEEVGGVSSPAGCLGCNPQKQEAPVGAWVTGLMLILF